MGGWLRPDSAFYRAWSEATALVLINLITLAACLPLITAGASLAACARAVGEQVRGEGAYPVRAWWRSLRQNLMQSLLWWTPVLVLLAVSAIEALAAPTLRGLLLAGLALLTAVLLWLLPLVAFFQTTARAHVLNAVRLAVGHLGRTAACLLIVGLLVLVGPILLVAALPSSWGPVVWFEVLVGPALALYLAALLQRPVIDALRERSAQRPHVGETASSM